MSRLTASPFHKPSPFEFPRGPPSPPETNTDTIIGPGHVLPLANILAAQDSGSMDAGTQGIHDTPLRAKKSSSIPYHNTSFRETKERAIQRNSNKSLIIVIPPSTLIQDHGQHGQTLSNGPLHRLTQGVVMPLLPSMFGQLTAIAREFNFPSTLGLCLYLHYVEDGLTLTPRISDDSWQSLWGHLSDPPLPNERRPLICGKVEFDIDLRTARWYSSWVSAIQREMSEHPSHAYPSTAPSHFRGESSVLGGRPSNDDMGDNMIQQLSAPVGRHIPKKLSLVERFDVASVKSDSRHNSRSIATSTEIPAGQQVLSTIPQEEEPKTARQQLDKLVKSWRASALISPSPLAAKGQTSLDPPNLPNNMPIDTPDEMPTSPASGSPPMRLEDFTWSISSAGPQSYGELSPVSWVHAPSVHLAHRLQGSVCTSPSTCTSFGFVEDDNYSYTFTEHRVPSVHLAERLQGSVCSSPLTCTSFGPDDDGCIYTSFFSRIPTPDIAQRFHEDCPPTPMTATSWGAPLSYPPSPRCDSPTLSVDLGDRARFHDQFETTVRYSRPMASEFSLASGQTESRDPWLHVWPYNGRPINRVASPVMSVTGPWEHVWPFNSEIENQVTSSLMPVTGPWEHVWPFNSEHTNDTISSVKLGNNLSSSSRGGMSVTVESSVFTSLWSHVWPFNIDATHGAYANLLQESSFGYPYFDIYPPVYPFIEIYPTVPSEIDVPTKSNTIRNVMVSLPVQYPIIQLYEPVYPFNLSSIYPTVIRSQTCNAQVETLGTRPSFDLCSPPDFLHSSPDEYNPRSQYPNFEIYPGPLKTASRFSTTPAYERALGTTLPGTYPTFNLYPAVYPNFDIYSCVRRPQREPASLVTDKMATPSLSPTLLTAYPSFNLYPNVYPYLNIYPTPYGTVTTVVEEESSHKHSLSPALHSQYPTFNLYPSLYPYLDIYPASYGSIDTAIIEEEYVPENSLSSALPPMYPSFNLYPSVYPDLIIYPGIYGSAADNADGNITELRTTYSLASGYPYFNLYPAIYPHLDIYPVPYFWQSFASQSSSKSLNEKLQMQNLPYPFFNLYPAVYPNFDLCPPRPETEVQQPKNPSRLNSSRLTHLELHAMVMMEKAQAESQHSFGHRQSFLDLSAIDSKMPFIHEDEEISQYLQEKSISNAARNIRISTVPIPTRDLRKMPSVAAYKSGSAVFLDSPIDRDQDQPFLREASSKIQDISPVKLLLRERLEHEEDPSSYRKSLNFYDRNITRSSSLWEPNGKPPIPPKPQIAMTRRRDSLVLQRVKTLDSNAAEGSAGISKETLLRFPMPPRAFPPLPPLPQHRGH